MAHGLELTLEQDLARRAALLLDGLGRSASASELPQLARRSGMPVRELVRRAVAFREGGLGGLAVLDAAWDPDQAQIETARALLGPGAVAGRNGVSLGERQLRLGRDGRCYPYQRDSVGRWTPDGAPLTALVDQGDLGELQDDAGPS